MSVLCVNVSAKYYELRCIFLKNCTSSKLTRLFDTASKFALFSVFVLKDDKLIKYQTYMKTENANSILDFWEYLLLVATGLMEFAGVDKAARSKRVCGKCRSKQISTMWQWWTLQE